MGSGRDTVGMEVGATGSGVGATGGSDEGTGGAQGEVVGSGAGVGGGVVLSKGEEDGLFGRFVFELSIWASLSYCKCRKDVTKCQQLSIIYTNVRDIWKTVRF